MKKEMKARFADCLHSSRDGHEFTPYHDYFTIFKDVRRSYACPVQAAELQLLSHDDDLALYEFYIDVIKRLPEDALAEIERRYQ